MTRLISIFGLLLALGGSAAAQSGCGGQFGDGKFCGNVSGAPGLPGPVLIPAGGTTPIGALTVLGNPTGSSALPVATSAPILGTSITTPILGASGPLTFQSNGSVLGGKLISGQWALGANAAPASGPLLTLNQNSATPTAFSGLTPNLHTVSANGVIGGISVDTFANQSIIIARLAGNTQASKTAVGAANTILSIGGQAYDGTTFSSGTAIDFNTFNAQTGSDHSGYIALRTVAGTTTSLSEKVRLSAAGGFSVSTTPLDEPAGVINALNGYRVGDAATSGNVLRGNGTNFVSATLACSDLSGGCPIVSGTTNQVAFYSAANALSGSTFASQGTTPAALGGALVGFTVQPFPSTNNKVGMVLGQGTGNGGSLTFFATNGTSASPTAIIANQEIGIVQALGWTGSAFGPPGGNTEVTFIATEGWTPTANGSSILFQATPNGSNIGVGEVCIGDGIVSGIIVGSCPKGLGRGTVNATAGIFDNSNRVFSAGNLVPIATGVSGLGSNVASALQNTLNASSGLVSFSGVLGTPQSGTATNLTGTAAGLTAGTVTTNANLTGAVTSVGNAASLGSFSSANLLTALTDETGSGVAVFGTSPILNTVDARGVWTAGATWTLPAHTLGGTVSGGGNQINNVIIGTTTPLAGSFTTLTTSTSETVPLIAGGTGAASTLTIESTSGAGTTDAILFKTGSQVERGRITNGGFFGIGFTGTAKTFLDVNASSGSSPALVVATSLARMQSADATAGGQEWLSYGSTTGNVLSGASAGGTSASPTATPGNTALFNLRGYGHNGTSFQSGAIIIMKSNSLWSGTNQATAIDFYTTPTTSTTVTLGMTLQPSGGLAIGGGGGNDPGIGGIAITGAVQARGTSPVGTTGSCVASSFTGGATAGKFAAAVCAAGTIILSSLPTAPNGYTCNAQDQTTPADTLKQTANTATSATFTATTVAADVVAFSCMAW